MALSDKLSHLLETKRQIKNAIIEQGVEVGENDTFRSYAGKIGDISTGDFYVDTIELDEGDCELKITSAKELKVYITEKADGSKEYNIKTAVYMKEANELGDTMIFGDYNPEPVIDYAYLSKDYLKNLNEAGVDVATITTLRLTGDSQYKTGTLVNANIGENIEAYLNETVLNIYSNKTIEMFNGGIEETETAVTIKGLTIAVEQNIETEEIVYEYYLSAVTSIILDNFDTTQITSLDYLCFGCSELTETDLSNLDTSNIVTMNEVFDGCSSLTSLNLSNFDTTNVTDMNYIFQSCSSLNSITFGDNFDTSNVTGMAGVFIETTFTSIDLSKFNTSSVTNISSMFSGCSNLTSLDLSNFDLTNTTEMTGMFSNCSELRHIYVSEQNKDWRTYPVEIPSNSMFEGCSLLPNFNEQEIGLDKAYAGEGGYFTLKESA